MPRTPRAPTPPSPPCPQKVDRATRLEDDPAAAVPTAPPTMRDVLGGLLNAIDAGAEEATRKLTRGALDEGSGGGQSYGMGRGGAVPTRGGERFASQWLHDSVFRKPQPRTPATRHQDELAERTAAAQAHSIREYEEPALSMWAEVPGSKVYNGLFPAYCLPSGATAYLYRARKTRVDEVHVSINLADGGGDDGGPDGDGVHAKARELVSRIGQLPFEPTPPVVPAAEPPPRPLEALLPELRDLSQLCCVLLPRHPPLPDAPPPPDEPPRARWRLEDSIFAPRPTEADSRDWFNGDSIAADVFEHDWARCAAKSMFAKFVDRADADSDASRHEMRRRYESQLRVFDYYASLGPGDPFAIQINAWGELTMWTHVADERSATCKQRDLDRVFVATNFEQDPGSDAGRANLDRALMRFEFLEALMRAAYAKFLESKPGRGGRSKSAGKSHPVSRSKADAAAHSSEAPPGKPRPKSSGRKAARGRGGDAGGDAGGDGEADTSRRDALGSALATLGPVDGFPDAWSRLMDVVLLPAVAPEALLDPDEFRRERLYNEDVDILLKERRPFLEAVFDHYRQLACSLDNPGRLDMVEWLEFMSESGLYHKYFTQREAKLAFIWARLRWRDESSSVAQWNRTRSLTFLDFLEALGRVADMVSPPPPEQLAKEGGFSSDTPTADYYARSAETSIYFPDRPSASLFVPKTRPLDDKLEQIFEVLKVNLMERFDARDMDTLLLRLSQGRGRYYQLGKSTMV